MAAGCLQGQSWTPKVLDRRKQAWDMRSSIGLFCFGDLGQLGSMNAIICPTKLLKLPSYLKAAPSLFLDLHSFVRNIRVSLVHCCSQVESTALRMYCTLSLRWLSPSMVWVANIVSYRSLALLAGPCNTLHTLDSCIFHQGRTRSVLMFSPLGRADASAHVHFCKSVIMHKIIG